jgi:hypothetical protein
MNKHKKKSGTKGDTAFAILVLPTFVGYVAFSSFISYIKEAFS